MRDLYNYRELIRNLVLKDLKLKYRDSVLGFLWSLANPLLLILVYSFVFGHILRGGPPDFAYFLMVGILPWNFFAQSLMMSTGSIIDNGNLLRKVALPMEVFPVTTVLFNLAQFVLALAVFFPMASPRRLVLAELFADRSAACAVHIGHVFFRFDRDRFLPRRAPFYRDFYHAHFLAHADHL